jgi:hypothetical protein
MIKTHLSPRNAIRMSLLPAFVCCVATISFAQLDPGSQTVDVVFDQTITILPNPIGLPVVPIPISTLGSFTVTWGAESMGEAQVTDFFGSGSGVILPAPGPYILDVPGTGPGATFSGNLSNITSASGQLISGDLAMNLTFSVAFADPAAMGLTLYTKDTSFFLGPLSGGSNVGAIYQDPMIGVTDVYTMIPGLGEILIAESSDRIVTGVPEPTSWMLLLPAFLVAARRRSASR